MNQNPADLGFGNRSDERKTYFTIVGGNFSLPVDKDHPDAVSRINKNEKEVWELRFNSLNDVTIRNIVKNAAGKFGPEWIVILEKNNNLLELKMGYTSYEAFGILHRLPNIVIDQPVTLQLYTYESTSLVVYQHSVKVEKYFQYDKNDASKMNGMPDGEWVDLNGKSTLNLSKQANFLNEMVEGQFREYFNNLPHITAPATVKTTSTATTQTVPAKPAEPVKGVITPLAAIPDSDQFKIEYSFACQTGFKGSFPEYKEFRAEYMDSGFTGTMDDYKKYKALPEPMQQAAVNPAANTQAKPAIPSNPPMQSQQPVSKPPMPPVKTAKEKPGTAVIDPLEAGFAEVKRLGYTGTKEEFQLWCDNAGVQPNEPMVNAAGELEFSDLPF